MKQKDTPRYREQTYGFKVGEFGEKWSKRLGLRDIKQSIWKGRTGGPIYGTSLAV